MKISDFNAPIDFNKRCLSTYEIKCPYCYHQISLINNEKCLSYWKERAIELEKLLQKAQKLFFNIDEYCHKNIGDSYMQSELRKIYNKYNETKEI